MKPTSETGWWIVTYTMALLGPSEDPPRAVPLQVQRKQVMVRCEHWREAFMKARRMGIEEERAESGQRRWQYVGINDLTPLPATNEEGKVVAIHDVTSEWKPLEDVFRDCVEDYAFARNFDEPRGAGATEPNSPLQPPGPRGRSGE